MKKILSMMVLAMFAGSQADAMPEKFRAPDAVQIRPAGQAMELAADFKKDKNRKKATKRHKKSSPDKTQKHKAVSRTADKRSSGDGFIDDDSRKSRDRDGYNKKQLADYETIGPEIQYYHRKKRSDDNYKK